MTRDRDSQPLDSLIDAFEAAVLEASDDDLLAVGNGAGAASVVTRALAARNYRSDGSRPVAPRERLRRAAMASQARVRNRTDVTKVRAQFSSLSEDSSDENDGDDPDLA